MRRRAASALLVLGVPLVLLACSSTSSTSGSGGSGGGRSGTGGGSGGAGAQPGGFGGGGAGAGSPGAGGAAGDRGAGGGPGSGGSHPGTGGGGGGSAAGTGGGEGGNPGTAGTAGSSSPPADGGAGGAPACPGLVCEDFEGGSIDPAKWDTVTSGGTLEVQTREVAHGKYALHLRGLGSGSDDWAILVAKGVPAALQAPVTFGRASMYFSAEVSASLHIQFPFAGHDGTGSAAGPAPFPKLRYLEVGSYHGQWQLAIDILDVSPLIEDSSYSGSNIPTGKWVCVEWEIDDQPERVTLWVDGAKAGVFDNTHINYSSDGTTSGGTFYQGKTGGIVGAFDTFGVGFHDWHPAKAFDVYYDDVVLDAQRIGCPAP
jgi:hypothetical protein